MPTSVAGMRTFYATASPALAEFRLYRPTAAAGAGKAYKETIALVQAIGDRCGLRGYFNLINFSPQAAASIVPKASDLFDMDARYRGVFMPPGFPPAGFPWTFINNVHADTAFINNCEVLLLWVNRAQRKPLTVFPHSAQMGATTSHVPQLRAPSRGIGVGCRPLTSASAASRSTASSLCGLAQRPLAQSGCAT